jgi:hypothetical protein
MSAQRRLLSLSEGPRFYNRVTELALFGSVFKAPPRLSVILGGPNVGKSLLCKRVLQDGGHNVAHLDLRSFGSSSAYQFHEALHREFKGMYSKMAQKLPNMVEIPGWIGAEWDYKRATYNHDFLSKDLDSIASTIPDMKVWSGKQFPVLFIDEASKLKHIPGEGGKEAARTLLKWCVLNTKQLKRMHVVLASSDSFFLEWLDELNIGRHASVYTVGDLSEESTAHFYRELVNEILPDKLKLKVPGFKEVYRVLGGHMFHIDLFVSDFGITEGIKTLDSFSPLRAAIARIKSALRVNQFQIGEIEKPKWTAEYLKALMERFASHPFVDYEEACLMMEGRGEEMVKSLIRHNVLLYRHNKDFAFDFPHAPDSPIVCPQSPMERYAMEKIYTI